MKNKKDQTISSALWAAYGDALGFPTELATSAIIQQRVGTLEVSRTKSWKRLVGGRFGAQAELPAGSYSDDTQLRLATSRSIRGDGFFDVESFAKIELPIWLAYCLGAGRGSKAAASSLSSRSTTWFSNFFSGNGNVYTNGGGNGAAMRVQPHVWSATNLENEETYLPSVVRNAICTHGHVRGIAGAMIHASTLAQVFRTGKIPGPEEWMDFASVIEKLPEIVAADSELSTFWKPTWEEQSKITLSDASSAIADEWADAAGAAINLINDNASQSYKKVVESLLGLTDSERGSGLKCSLFALVGAWLFRSDATDSALKVVVNLLKSDTDTIGTMLGALLGARPNEEHPFNELQDKNYIVSEAVRMFNISIGENADSFTYPDLLYWQPPNTPLDAVCSHNNGIVIAGLGAVKLAGDEYKSNQKGTVWQWLEMPFGQTILSKRRSILKPITKNLLSAVSLSVSNGKKFDKGTPKLINSIDDTKDLFIEEEVSDIKPNDLEKILSLDEMTDKAIRANFDVAIIGQHILQFSDSPNAIELAIAYVAIVIKAKRARLKKAAR